MTGRNELHSTRIQGSFMRSLTLAKVSGLLYVLASASAFAQPPGNGFGFRASGASPQEPSYLMQSESVQKELKLSEAQNVELKMLRENEENGSHPFFRGLRGKSSEEIQQALEQHAEELRDQIAKVLTPEQVNRLHEIHLQVAGVDALGFDDVADKLGLTQTQRAQLNNNDDDARRRLAELNAQMGSMSPNDAQQQAWKAKQTEIAAARNASALAILTGDQLKKFDTLQGEKFDTSTVKRNQRKFTRRGQVDAPPPASPTSL